VIEQPHSRYPMLLRPTRRPGRGQLETRIRTKVPGQPQRGEILNLTPLRLSERRSGCVRRSRWHRWFSPPAAPPGGACDTRPRSAGSGRSPRTLTGWGCCPVNRRWWTSWWYSGSRPESSCGAASRRGRSGRPTVWPVWNHHLRCPVCIYSAEDGPAEDALTALAHGHPDRVRPPAPSHRGTAGTSDHGTARRPEASPCGSKSTTGRAIVVWITHRRVHLGRGDPIGTGSIPQQRRRPPGFANTPRGRQGGQGPAMRHEATETGAEDATGPAPDGHAPTASVETALRVSW
jgi:hypothetical protein